MIVDELNQALGRVIPGAYLEAITLPEVPPLQLYLLNANYPQQNLDAEAVAFIMNNPLYWVFCWASGQVLARLILREPERVKGRRVVDFGSGSGVVAIAAAMAGASEVIACDTDPVALAACEANAALNQVTLALSDDFSVIDGDVDVITAADVLYDRANLPWLSLFSERATSVLMADSRMPDFELRPYELIARRTSSTWPDLDESQTFRQVRVYQVGAL
ncbi:MAG: protein methyltransferase [Gammaproteobacteria bacterium]|nr:MAG: protein methyltransferase [Gammaproteobacteria bacterium]